MNSRSASRRTLPYAVLIGLLLIPAALVPGTASAQTPAAAGRWEGAISLPGTELQVVLTLVAPGTAWSGTIDIPAQGAAALPLGKVAVEGSAVSFTLPGVPGEPAFKGTLAPDGASLVRHFHTGRADIPVQAPAKGRSLSRCVVSSRGVRRIRRVGDEELGRTGFGRCDRQGRQGRSREGLRPAQRPGEPSRDGRHTVCDWLVDEGLYDDVDGHPRGGRQARVG